MININCLSSSLTSNANFAINSIFMHAALHCVCAALVQIPSWGLSDAMSDVEKLILPTPLTNV